MNFQYYIIFILFSIIDYSNSYKVLVFNPAFGASHSNFLGKISDILIDAGHDVTMLIPIAMQGKKHLVGSKKVKNIIRIDQDPRSIELYKQTGAEDVLRKKIWKVESDIALFFKMAGNFSKTCGYQCQHVFQQTEILEKLKNEHFELGITESLFICGYPLFDHLGVKTIINADSVLFMDIVKCTLGEPSSSTFYPALISPMTDKMTLVERIKNAIQMLIPVYFSKMRFEEELSMIEPYYNGSKTWEELLENVAFNMVNSNRYLDYASPTLPKTVFIGGMQVKTKKQGTPKLNKEWDDLLNIRKENVLVSFGSNAFSSEMPDEFKKSFLDVFASMPEITFIWKYEQENSTIAMHLSNVKMTTWMPQSDLLADNRLSLFVTHGGLGSSIELAYQGTPAVVIPLMADQPRNAHMLTRHGGAIQLDKTNLDNPQMIRDAIKTILDNDSYTENARKLAQILEDQPYTPAEVVLKHCDFAVKFGVLDTLQSEGRKLNVFQFYSYDILVVVCFLIITVVVFIVLYVFQCIKICSTIFSKKVKNE
ncbi:glucuronosyltransferase [Caenorhabditis elegans]|uniref:glucuronosyltransferase n=1 Tax=Caenorhabditis elegans TaxID=6239 RepID=Q17813_CAEEL|nr:glucuronosyltransferase [Caenorhabditis elegans]CAA96584.2 glucuronosyltransferase [Caenorhabditis elegans]|eukprot:NP_505597.2 UDP-GlucuronosylTransferase [Caenorhabditis elegans]